MSTSLKIHIFNSFGQLNNKKIDKLGEYFGKEYPILIQDGDGVILNKHDGSRIMVFKPDRMVLIENTEIDSKIDFDTMQEDIDMTFDKFMLEDKTKMIINVIHQIPSSEVSSMTQSLNLLKDDSNLKTLDNFIGIGLRFFTKHGNELWEFKIEPYVKDDRYFFIEGICNFTNECISFKEVTPLVQSTYNDFKEKVEEVKEYL